jgi:hypothetical protein
MREILEKFLTNSASQPLQGVLKHYRPFTINISYYFIFDLSAWKRNNTLKFSAARIIIYILPKAKVGTAMLRRAKFSVCDLVCKAIHSVLKEA